ncbi:hypothetical protein AYO20_10575 [Fonsecaea nubica]|uniref:Protein kinase domain-containing protein n=1 Tax=Fonsecaea nubica TaxID=856822 RepID=A0A178C7J3_9EURO|nr:hypothetical protein AYO20_10575 [Fonsecaea nubica]OAL24972.1 hypothetical protein AYO20_10575 [Fonsecaea nubica]
MHFGPEQDTPTLEIPYDGLRFLSACLSSVVYVIDTERVLKTYHDTDNNEDIVERRAYARLGEHPNIARFLGSTSTGDIVLERGRVLREVLRQPNGDVSIRRKVQWLKDYAHGLQHCHSKGIVHADVGCHNAILNPHGRVQLIDFAGCSIDGAEASYCYEWFSYRRSGPVSIASVQTDIFALGCMIFEVVTGRPPFQDELETSPTRTHIVEERYMNDQFPDLQNLPAPLREVTRACWHDTVHSMEDVARMLEALDGQGCCAKLRAWINTQESYGMLASMRDWENNN